MSWQLGAFAILFVALAGGFAWYERTRPDARIVALVATLAAFAALGRIAFAALPNVKPTTDIVLISGFALGPAPGFVVGAVAGLTSNFFFGQGPWTPWQMAAWGATGLVGAGLGVATGRRFTRWPLALVCGVVGFAFTAFQDFGDWVTYGDHSLTQLGVYVGKGLGFDAVHAAGCLVFALAFGPALARSVGRFAARLEVRWHTPGGAMVPLLVASVVLALGAEARPAGVARAGANPTEYLLGAQNSDGGFGGAPGQSSSQLFSGWAALGLAAEGYNPQRVTKGGHSLSSYLSRGTATDPGSVERTILAVAASGLNPGSLVATLERDIGGDGSVSEQTNLTSFAVLALRAAGVSPRPATISWLIRQEDQDGGFNFATAGAVSDVDDTGAALEALASVPGSVAARARARAAAFVRGQQDSDGGFPASAGAGSNAQSSAWAIQGLLAAGVSGRAVSRGLSYLSSLTAPDGHVRYSRSSDQSPVWVTAEAAMALAGKPLPLSPVGLSAHAPVVRHQHTTSPAHPRRRTSARSVRISHPKRGTVTRAVAPSALSQRLATDAGILETLALAPVGVG